MGHRDFKTTLIYADYAHRPMRARWSSAPSVGTFVGTN